MPEKLHERLQQVLNTKKMFNKDLAAVMGIKSQTLTAYLQGKAAPKPPALIELNQKLGIDLNWLLTGEGTMDLHTEQTEQPQPNTQARGPVTEAVYRLENAMQGVEEYEVIKAAMALLKNRAETRAAELGIYGSAARENCYTTMHEPPARYTDPDTSSDEERR